MTFAALASIATQQPYVFARRTNMSWTSTVLLYLSVIGACWKFVASAGYSTWAAIPVAVVVGLMMVKHLFRTDVTIDPTLKTVTLSTRFLGFLSVRETTEQLSDFRGVRVRSHAWIIYDTVVELTGLAGRSMVVRVYQNSFGRRKDAEELKGQLVAMTGLTTARDLGPNDFPKTA
jgi:hypothetical protein